MRVKENEVITTEDGGSVIRLRRRIRRHPHDPPPAVGLEREMRENRRWGGTVNFTRKDQKK